MYSVAQAEQLKIFLTSLGVGFLLGMLYDIFRFFRLSFSRFKAATVIIDTLYFLLFGFLSYIFILTVNKGEIRFYILLGEALGASFWYFAFAPVSFKITNAVVRFLKRTYWVVTYPFRALAKAISALNEKIKQKRKKTAKNTQKMRKKLLPKTKIYVYNIFGIFQGKKGGNSLGSQRKKAQKADEQK